MLLKCSSAKRRGAHLVECAIVLPVTFFLILAIMVGGLGVFRYQELASLSREAARYAATHGGQYQKENNQAILAGTLPNVTKAYIINNTVLPKAYWLDHGQLQVSIQFNNPNGSFDWDDTANNGQRWPFTIQDVDGNGTKDSVTNTVSVKITYNYYPELRIWGPYTLTSTSVMPMSY
jgi:Flp pilus assembly protein TadG